MTDKQIKQNAEEYAKKIYPYTVGKAAAIRDFIAGAHSRDEEIEELQNELESIRKGFYERGDKLKELMLANNKLRNDNKDLEQALACAEDVVDFQRKELDQLRNPWISVEERLPQLNKICFGMRDGKMPRICMLVKKKNGECVFNTPNEEYEYPKGKITHWMPIPQIEKEE